MYMLPVLIFTTFYNSKSKIDLNAPWIEFFLKVQEKNIEISRKSEVHAFFLVEILAWKNFGNANAET